MLLQPVEQTLRINSPGSLVLRTLILAGAGEYYAVNVPLRDGIDDNTYEGLFKPVINRIMEAYQPEAVVFQCGMPHATPFCVCYTSARSQG